MELVYGGMMGVFIVGFGLGFLTPVLLLIFVTIFRDNGHPYL